VHEPLVQRQVVAHALAVQGVLVAIGRFDDGRQASAGGQRPLIRDGRRLRLRRRTEGFHRRRDRRLGEARVPGRPHDAVRADDAQPITTAVERLGHDVDVITVVDRLGETYVDDAAGEKLLAPGLRERIRRIGEHLDARDERAGETEAAGDLVVVDLVVGVRSEVRCSDAIRVHTNCEIATAANSSER